MQNLVFLGTVLDFETGSISNPEERILKLKSSIDSCLQDNFISSLLPQRARWGFFNLWMLVDAQCPSVVSSFF